MTLKEVVLWVREPLAVPPIPMSATARFYIQGGFNRLADFTQTLRAELQGLGVTVELAQRDEEYDYTMVPAPPNPR